MNARDAVVTLAAALGLLVGVLAGAVVVALAVLAPDVIIVGERLYDPDEVTWAALGLGLLGLAILLVARKALDQ